MGTRSDRTTRPTGGAISRAAGYALKGSLLEAGDDTALEGGPDRAPRERWVGVWRIDSGHIDGIDVAGRIVLTVRRRSRQEPGRGIVLLDEGANPEQALAITDAFSGRLGGPLAFLAGQAGAGLCFSQVPIEYWTAADERVAWVPQRVKFSARLETLPKRAPRPPTTGFWCRARGREVQVSVDLPEYGLTWHESGMDARAWAFHLVADAHPEGTDGGRGRRDMRSSR